MAQCICSGTRWPHRFCRWSEPLDFESLDTSVVPVDPGFYVFTDHAGPLVPSGAGGQVLYIGEARNLRKRLKTYKIKGISAWGHRGAAHLLGHERVVTAGGKGDDFTLERHAPSPRAVAVQIRRRGEPVEETTLKPRLVYVRWAADHRQAIEAYLIEELRPRFNTVFG